MDGYLDRELDLVRMIDLERHLHECESCSALHRSRIAVRATLPSLRYSASAELKKAVSASLSQKAPRRKVDWISMGAIAATLVIGFAWFFRPDLNRVQHEVVDSHIRSLMAGHLEDVPSTDQHTVKPWFQGKIDFSPPVQDFASEGFPLIGGRIDYFDNHPVAAVVYKSNQHVINVFAWRSTETVRMKRTSTERGYHLMQFVKDGVEYWVVSDVNEQELGRFAKLALGV
jgi:anti-sigma factor RsiW